MSDNEKEVLFTSNMQQVGVMQTAAGSMIKQLLHELEKRQTHIRLHDAVSNGHIVQYTFVEGDADLISRLARILAFKDVTSTRLEVRS